MGRSTRKVSGYTPDQIKALFNNEDKYKIGLRLYAVYQVSLGKPSRELEALYNTSFKQILNWVSRFEKEGIEGLKDKTGRGRKPKLTEDQKTELSQLILEATPEDYGYNSATWNGPLLIDWIEKHMGVSYKRAQIYNILKGLGFSYQKSKGIYPEADLEKQGEFKEELKKTLGESC
ncbi:IS630 family transposase [Aquimarina sp. ERC-38]|uniref:IS630 family transposase n=1 Tax=Aquimarina sp. ERC-38 TaxID=2949996 RepID=UPI002245BB1F|nr:IS630 family transposase [Aquimarina sp. ERC-38]UZO79690.1 IS630 family transposase [Aquimarina sp. ERC-38]UZO79923.1 IS630 family transposase [Aquimarina sp. ERC-38]UZO80626.1 IS630 family transposase [Aquimarina sp. ERC-38]UZO80644.1 IS630 family transposase [Aquimarina sp. ERC-38]